MVRSAGFSRPVRQKMDPMAENMLRKLFRRMVELPTEVRDAIASLTQLAREHPTLADPANLLRQVLPILYSHPMIEAVPALSAEQAAEKLSAGVALLRGEPLVIDAGGFRRRWQSICEVIGREQKAQVPSAIAAALRLRKFDPQDLTNEILAGRPQAIHAQADALGLDVPLTSTVLWLTLFPVLSAIQTALAPLRRTSRWEHGYCPTCGSWPLLGEYRGLEQVRWLRCGLCADEWEFSRLQCPFCGNTDHRLLGYLHVDGEDGKCRACVCDGCRGYLKTLFTLFPLAAPTLLVADIATMHLNLVAAERDYAAQ